MKIHKSITLPNSGEKVLKKSKHQVKNNKKRRNKSDLGKDFVAPDGGWGWIICLACGFSMLFAQAPLQQYGLLYRQRLFTLGFDAKQIVSLINTQMAASKLPGLIHGPLFRRITFRIAAIIGSVFIFAGVFATAFCTSFYQYVFSFSIIYGFGMGLSVSSVILAVNTYFKNYRRRATGLAATVTGLGPVLFPQIVTFVLKEFGQSSTIFIMSALTLNCFVCGCTLQPVLWHVKKEENNQETPKSDNKKQKIAEKLTTLSTIQVGENKTQDNVNNPTKTEEPSTENDLKSFKAPTMEPQKQAELNTFRRIVKFFDLDLLSDLTFLNLIQGISIMMFGELNFSILTPFILGSYNYTDEKISLIMSLLAGVDILARLIAPFLLEKVKASNRLLFAIGICIISVGRFLVTLSNSYWMLVAIFLLIGFGKAFRTVFYTLIIPSYVPLNRLPAANGLQSVFDAVFSLSCGPILGMIVDATNYTVAIHVINATAAFSLLLWLIEWLLRNKLYNSGIYTVS